MQFCENCRVVSDDKRCPLCGSKKLRQVMEDDFCLLTENKNHYCEMLENIFKEQNIPCAVLPYGEGFETQLGLRLSVSRVFVPYSSLENAKNIIKKIEEEETNEFKTFLLENANKLNIEPRLERKLCKKLKIAEEQFFEYCIDIIGCADKIKDGGLTTGGHYLFCYWKNVILTVTSEKFEIVSLTVK